MESFDQSSFNERASNLSERANNWMGWKRMPNLLSLFYKLIAKTDQLLGQCASTFPLWMTPIQFNISDRKKEEGHIHTWRLVDFPTKE
ncbi:hypothetical protein PHMEG_00028599 [Phytophthora megakarya]|uniref:Uncharacterized protein n=1 Tax=Phytophthora megakarya TaxID=4795 RepID=A0A225V4J6_9STRA|nr:hypothetical protein PHMEG_00028599 [Phytophthora megakarya]